MQTELTNAKQNAKLKIKYANRNLNARQKTKQNKMLEDKDGQDDAHVGATSPSLGVSTSW